MESADLIKALSVGTVRQMRGYQVIIWGQGDSKMENLLQKIMTHIQHNRRRSSVDFTVVG